MCPPIPLVGNWELGAEFEPLCLLGLWHVEVTTNKHLVTTNKHLVTTNKHFFGELGIFRCVSLMAEFSNHVDTFLSE